MFIESIKYDESKSAFKLTFDDNKTYLVSYEVYEGLKIKKQEEISQETLDKIKREDMFIKAKSIAGNYINYKPRTESEIVTRLYKEYIDQDIIDEVIELYKRNHLIDDERYAKELMGSYVYNKKFSRKKTKYKLIQKGLSSSLIDCLIEDLDPDLELENCKFLIEKKYKKLDLNDYKEKSKVYRYLASNGFDSYTISRALGEIYDW